MNTNDKIRAYIKKHGLLKKYVAERLGVSRQTVTNWCSGMTRPKQEHLDRLFKLTGERFYR